MGEGCMIKSAQSAASVEELRQIGRYTRRELLPGELYVSSIVLCDNEIDHDFERFTIPVLHRLGELFLGETGLSDHSMKSGDQTTWIFSTHVETDPQERIQMDGPHTWLVARAYLPKTEKNADLILELGSGIKKEVSVGCTMGKPACPVCGMDRAKQLCGHMKGCSYNGEEQEQICYTVLDKPANICEWPFVAVPVQRVVRVIRAFRPGKEKVDLIEETRKSLRAGEQITLTATQTGELEKHLRQSEALTESGKQYRESVGKNVVGLCAFDRTGIPAKVMGRVVQSMSFEDPLPLEKALKQQAEGTLPLRPQLAPEHPEAVGSGNGMFRI